MVEINFDKVAEEKCGIALTIKTNRIKELTKELDNAIDAALIMVLCDKITDEIMGFDTNGFRIR